MLRDQKELGNKLGTYADTITAFSFLQSATFSYALGTNDTFLAHATRVWWLVPSFLIVGNLFYAYLVRQCHRGEDALLEPLESPGGAWEKKVRKWRMAMIALGLILSIVSYVGSFYGSRHPPETDTPLTKIRSPLPSVFNDAAECSACRFYVRLDGADDSTDRRATPFPSCT
jgi:hypothetical protein